jgi:hypothetical protein
MTWRSSGSSDWINASRRSSAIRRSTAREVVAYVGRFLRSGPQIRAAGGHSWGTADRGGKPRNLSGTGDRNGRLGQQWPGIGRIDVRYAARAGL